jgi:hypothetical protein
MICSTDNANTRETTVYVVQVMRRRLTCSCVLWPALNEKLHVLEYNRTGSGQDLHSCRPAISGPSVGETKKKKFLNTSWFKYRNIILPYSILIPCIRGPLEKLTVTQLVRKVSSFNGTRRFITAFTRVRHLSLSWARSIQSLLRHPTSRESPE